MTAWFTGHRVLRACPSVASVRTPSSVRLDGALLCGQTTFCLSTICCWGLGWSPPISVVNQPGLTPHGVHTPYSNGIHTLYSPRRPHRLTPHGVHTASVPTASTPPHSLLAIPPRFSPAATRFQRSLVLAPARPLLDGSGGPTTSFMCTERLCIQPSLWALPAPR